MGVHAMETRLPQGVFSEPDARCAHDPTAECPRAARTPRVGMGLVTRPPLARLRGMTLRGHINGALRKTTGYQIVRAGTEPPPRRPPAPPRQKEQRSRAQEGSAQVGAEEETASKTTPITRRTTTPTPGRPSADPRPHDDPPRADPVPDQAVRYVDPPRGARRHRGVRGVARRVDARLSPTPSSARGDRPRPVPVRHLHGMTRTDGADVRINAGQARAPSCSTPRGRSPVCGTVPSDYVATARRRRGGFRHVDYPEERVHFVAGKVEDTVPEHAPDVISVLRLDTDWYESTKHELDHLYRGWSPGRRADHRRLRDLGGVAGGHRRVPRRDRRAPADDPGRPPRITVKPGLRSVV